MTDGGLSARRIFVDDGPMPWETIGAPVVTSRPVRPWWRRPMTLAAAGIILAGGLGGGVYALTSGPSTASLCHQLAGAEYAQGFAKQIGDQSGYQAAQDRIDHLNDQLAGASC